VVEPFFLLGGRVEKEERPMRQEVEKGITIGSAYGWGAALGGIMRASPKAAAAVEFVGAIGGLIGAMIAPAGLADAFEGIASGSGALLGMALTAPTTARRVIQGKGETTAKGKVERMMLKEAGGAKEAVFGAEVRAAMVGAGLPE
jgi:hypothetical protein